MMQRVCAACDSIGAQLIVCDLLAYHISALCNWPGVDVTQVACLDACRGFVMLLSSAMFTFTAQCVFHTSHTCIILIFLLEGRRK